MLGTQQIGARAFPAVNSTGQTKDEGKGKREAERESLLQNNGQVRRGNKNCCM